MLSNFAHIERLDLLRLALSNAATTSQVMTELEKGVASGRVPACDLEWLDVVKLTSFPQLIFDHCLHSCAY